MVDKTKNDYLAAEQISKNLNSLLEPMAALIDQQEPDARQRNQAKEYLYDAITGYISNPSADPDQAILKRGLERRYIAGLELDDNKLQEIVQLTEKAPPGWHQQMQNVPDSNAFPFKPFPLPHQTEAAREIMAISRESEQIRQIRGIVPGAPATLDQFLALNEPDAVMNTLLQESGSELRLAKAYEGSPDSSEIHTDGVPQNSRLYEYAYRQNGEKDDALQAKLQEAIKRDDVVYMEFTGPSANLHKDIEAYLKENNVEVIDSARYKLDSRSELAFSLLVSKADFEKMMPELVAKGQEYGVVAPVIPQGVPGKKAALDQGVAVAQAAPAPAVTAAPAVAVTDTPTTAVPPAEQAPVLAVAAAAQEPPMPVARPEVVPDAQAQRFALALDKATEFVRGQAGEKGQYITGRTRNAEAEQQVEQLASAMGVDGLTMDGNMSRKEIFALQEKLGFTEGKGLDGIIGKNTLARMEVMQASLNDVHMPTTMAGKIDKGGQEIV